MQSAGVWGDAGAPASGHTRLDIPALAGPDGLRRRPFSMQWLRAAPFLPLRVRVREPAFLSSNAFQRCRSCAQAGVPLLLLPHVSPGARRRTGGAHSSLSPAHTRRSTRTSHGARSERSVSAGRRLLFHLSFTCSFTCNFIVFCAFEEEKENN